MSAIALCVVAISAVATSAIAMSAVATSAVAMNAVATADSPYSPPVDQSCHVTLSH